MLDTLLTTLIRQLQLSGQGKLQRLEAVRTGIGSGSCSFL
jgi:hypothetical protein